MFKMNEVAFRTDKVTYPEMIAMAEKTVREMTGTESESANRTINQDGKAEYRGYDSLTTIIGGDYIFYVNACKLFTTMKNDDAEIFTFMDVVMENEKAFGEWLENGSGEKYRMYKKMVETGLKHVYDKPVVAKLLDEAIRFIQKVNDAVGNLDLADKEDVAALLSNLESLVKGNAAAE